MAQSSDPYNPEAMPAPPSRTYRSQSSTITAERHPAAPVRPEAPPAPEVSKTAEIAQVVEAADVAEPYSPFRVPPQRQLPPMVFPVADAGPNNKPEKPRTAMATVFIVLGVLSILAIGFLSVGAYFLVQTGNSLQGALTDRAQAGQCYTSQVRFIDCGSAHTYEVFGANQLAERANYPGVLKRTLGSEACEFHFFDYVGVEYFSSSYVIYSVYPTEAEWADGQRWEVCVLSDDAVTPLVGSAVAS
jgi:hypothetical protein